MGEPVGYKAPRSDTVEKDIEISHLRRDLYEARIALNPLLNLAAQIRAALGNEDPKTWPEIIFNLRRAEQDAKRYKRLVQRLISGEVKVCGVHFVMLENKPPLPSDFDREMDSDE